MYCFIKNFKCYIIFLTPSLSVKSIGSMPAVKTAIKFCPKFIFGIKKLLFSVIM